MHLKPTELSYTDQKVNLTAGFMLHSHKFQILNLGASAVMPSHVGSSNQMMLMGFSKFHLIES